MAKGEMDHPYGRIEEFVTDIKHLKNFDKTLESINLIESLPEDAQIIYCHAFKFLTSSECEMYLAMIKLKL